MTAAGLEASQKSMQHVGLQHAPQCGAGPRQDEHDSVAAENGGQLRKRALRLGHRRASKCANRAQLADDCPRGCPRHGPDKNRDRRAWEAAMGSNAETYQQRNVT